MILQTLWLAQKRETGHMWEIDFNPLGLLLAERNREVLVELIATFPECLRRILMVYW